MLKLFKKAQQEYIATLLRDHNARTPWAEKDGVYLITDEKGAVAYFIPGRFLHIRLEDERKAPGLAGFIPDPDGMEPAQVVYTNAKGQTRLQSEHHTVYADAKKLKPFLAVKGVRLEVTGPTAPIRVYAEGAPFCVGIVLPVRPPKED